MDRRRRAEPWPSRRRLAPNMDNELSSSRSASATGTLVHNHIPPWRLVAWLAWPVLVQQLLIWIVNRSDGFLAGYFKPGEGEHVAYQSAQTNAMYLSWAISSCTVIVGAGGTALVAGSSALATVSLPSEQPINRC